MLFLEYRRSEVLSLTSVLQRADVGLDELLLSAVLHLLLPRLPPPPSLVLLFLLLLFLLFLLLHLLFVGRIVVQSDEPDR